MNNPNHSQGDEHLRIAILGILLFLVMGSLFSLFQEKTMDFISLIAWYHVKIVMWLFDVITLKKDHGDIVNYFVGSLHDIEPYLNPLSDFVVGSDLWWKLHQVAGRAFFLIYILPIGIIIWASFGRRPDLIFRNRYSLDSLWENQPIKGTKVGFLERLAHPSKSKTGKEHDSETCVGYLINPLTPMEKSDILEPALTPEAWLTKEGLIQQDYEGKRQSSNLDPFDQQIADEICTELTIDGISEVFEEKIGSSWNGFASLRNYEKGLVAAQILHFAFLQDSGLEILKFLTATFDACHPDEENFDQALGRDRWFQSAINKAFDSGEGKKLEEEAGKHAWKNTALVTTLRMARKEGGVLPTAYFLWLKLIDRTLWYTLNNAGNAVSSVESAGVHAHYRAEIQSNIPLVGKNVFQVSRSLLEDYLGMKPNQVTRRKLYYDLNRPVGDKIRDIAITEQPFV